MAGIPPLAAHSRRLGVVLGIAVLVVVALGVSSAVLRPGSETSASVGDLGTGGTYTRPGKVAPDVTDALAATSSASVIVSLTSGSDPAASQARVLAAVPATEFGVTGQYQAVPALAGKATAAGLLALAAQPDVAHVALNREVHASLAEAVPLINADDAHNLLGVTGEGVVVAVLDTGIDTDHPLLSDDLIHEECFLGADCPAGPHPAEDGNGHGSHVSGIITSAGPPIGIAPDAQIEAFKVLDDNGSGSFDGILAAYDHIIVSHPEVDLINMSLGDETANAPGTCEGIIPALTTAIAATRAMGITTFAASGNNGVKGGIGYPACITDAVSVGAVYDANLGYESWGFTCIDPTTMPDQVVCFSQSDPSLDLLAPGARIDSTVPGGGLASKSGTSMASPAAAAVAALLLESAPLLMPAQVESRLEETGVPIIDSGNGVTTCRVDAYQAVVNDGGPICASSGPSPTVCPPQGNDGFEAGPVKSNLIPCWTVVDQEGGFDLGSWCTQMGNLTPQGVCSGGFTYVEFPPEGLRAAMTNQNGFGSHVLYRCGVLASGQLSFQLYIRNASIDFYSPPSLSHAVGSNQQFRADLVSKAGINSNPFTVGPGDVLLNIYQTQPGDAPVSGYTNVTANASAHVGQNVCLRFAEVDTRFYFNAGVDDVQFDTAPKPTPTPCAPEGCPTSTPTNTPTATNTPTPTNTPTSTRTPTDTPTPTPCPPEGCPTPKPLAPNDDFADATLIASVPYSDHVDTSGATLAANDPDMTCAFYGQGHSVWYQYTPPADQALTIDTNGTSYYTVLGVFSGSKGTLTQHACNSYGQASLVNVNLTGGTTYHILVGSFTSTPGGKLKFNIGTPKPLAPNDDFAAATLIASIPYSDHVGTSGATRSFNDPQISCKFFPFGVLGYSASIWYQYTPPEDQALTIHTNDSTYDTVLAVFSGGKGGLTEHACDDDSGTGLASLINVKLTGGTTYHILVGSWAFLPGGKLKFNIDIWPATPTPTPCPAEGCPTPTSTATPTPTGTPTPTRTPTATPTPDPRCPPQGCEMSLTAENFDPGSTGVISCDDPAKPATCQVAVGEPFEIVVVGNAFPAGDCDLDGTVEPGEACIAAFDSLVSGFCVGSVCPSGRLLYDQKPDCLDEVLTRVKVTMPGGGGVAAPPLLCLRAIRTNYLQHGAIGSLLPPQPPLVDETLTSAAPMDLVKLNVSCPAPGAYKLLLRSLSDYLTVPDGDTIFVRGAYTLNISCVVRPTATSTATAPPTRTPGPSLGGVADYPDLPSGTNAGLLTAALAAMAAAAVGAAWYARRRS